MNGYITLKELSERWEITERRIRTLCEQGRIFGATKMGHMWIVPENCEKPSDQRIRTGNYIKHITEKN